MTQKRRRVRPEEGGLAVPKQANEESMPVSKDEADGLAQALAEVEVDCACPRLDAEDWDRVENDWSDIAFAEARTNALLGVPVGYDSTRKELRETAAAVGGTIPDDAMLLVGSGRFRRQILLEVEGTPEDARGILRPGGIAYTRLLQAPWGQLPKLTRNAQMEARQKYGRDPDNTWVWYLTCRECSKPRNFETLIVTHYRNSE